MKFKLSLLFLIMSLGCENQDFLLSSVPRYPAPEASNEMLVQVTLTVLRDEAYGLERVDEKSGIVTTNWKNGLDANVFTDSMALVYRTRIVAKIDYSAKRVWVEVFKQVRVINLATEETTPWSDQSLSEEEHILRSRVGNRIYSLVGELLRQSVT